VFSIFQHPFQPSISNSLYLQGFSGFVFQIRVNLCNSWIKLFLNIGCSSFLSSLVHHFSRFTHSVFFESCILFLVSCFLFLFSFFSLHITRSTFFLVSCFLFLVFRYTLHVTHYTFHVLSCFFFSVSRFTSLWFIIFIFPCFHISSLLSVSCLSDRHRDKKLLTYPR